MPHATNPPSQTQTSRKNPKNHKRTADPIAVAKQTLKTYSIRLIFYMILMLLFESTSLLWINLLNTKSHQPSALKLIRSRGSHISRLTSSGLRPRGLVHSHSLGPRGPSPLANSFRRFPNGSSLPIRCGEGIYFVGRFPRVASAFAS